MARKAAETETETETPKAKKGAAPPKVGKLANIAAAAKKVLKGDSWHAKIDPDSLEESHPHVPTGSLIIDYLIGGVPNANGVPPCPGLPRKCVTQLWGQEGAGKTTLALTASAATIASGGVVFYVDWENAISIDYASKLGVPVADDTKFMLVQPSTLEEGLKLIRMAAIGGADLIVIDSVGAAVPENIAGRDVGETGEQARVGLAAQRWSEFLPQLRGDILKSNAAVLGISQTRSKIGGMGHGPQFEPQGGQAWKFYTDLRIEIRRFQQEKAKLVNMLSNRTEERVIGNIVKAKIVKCKLSDAQGREENFYIRQGEGIDDIRATIEIAVNHNVIRKQGAWFNYGDLKWQGMEQVRKHFKTNRSDLAELINKIKPHLSKKTDEGPEADVDDDIGDALDDFIKEVDAAESE